VSSSLDTLADEQLAARFQRGDPRALDILIARYRRLARARSRGYFLIGGDADDLEQEALIGLSEAARDFRPEHKVSFRSFALVCLTRQILTAIRSANSRKHHPLNQCMSISSRDNSGDAPIDYWLPANPDGDPAETLMANERLERLRTSIVRDMTSLEIDVLTLYMEGKTYKQIGDAIGRHVKAVDNAIQRIRTKLQL
jgi:RNA polymerase sporulation-specific sigma factor